MISLYIKRGARTFVRRYVRNGGRGANDVIMRTGAASAGSAVGARTARDVIMRTPSH